MLIHKKLSIGIFTLFCLFLTLPAQSICLNLDLGLFFQYELPPNEPQDLKNPLFLPLSAKCTVHTEDDDDELYIELLSKKAQVNEIALAQGETMSLKVRAGDKLLVRAEAGSHVRLTNLGKHNVKAICST